MKILSYLMTAALLITSCGPVKQSEEYIKDRVLKIYTSDSIDREREFTSSEFYDLWKKVTEDTSYHVDYDHWIDGQDDTGLVITIIDIHKESNAKATVALKLTNCGTTRMLTLPLVFERNDWYVDDIIYSDARPSEKAILKFSLEFPQSEPHNLAYEEEQTYSSYKPQLQAD